MHTRQLIDQWFALWTNGDFMQLPLSPDFRHTSPYGTVDGKDGYLKLAEDNKDKFLGNSFEILDTMVQGDKACVRYIMKSKNASLPVSEWFFIRNGQIAEIIAYYSMESDLAAGRGIQID